jgi:thiol-disulfide isomerase/thioredoxin
MPSCDVALILRRCGVHLGTLHSSGFRAPCIWAFLSSLQKNNFFSKLLMVMNMSKITKILLGVLWCLMVLVSPSWSVEVGERLPDFAVQTFDGHHSSRASLDGKPFLLIFWNTWCPICMEELPKINRFAEKFGPGRLAILAINTGINDNESKARTYWKKSAYVYSSGFDHDFEMTTAFGVRGVPTIFLVDSKGVVRYKHVVLPGDMEERVKQLSLN